MNLEPRKLSKAMWSFRSRERKRKGTQLIEAYDVTISSVVGARSMQFRVRRRTALVALAGVTVAALLFIVWAISAGHLLRQAADARAIRSENMELRRQLSRLTEIEDRLETLDGTRRALLRVAGVEDLNPAGPEPTLGDALREQAGQMYVRVAPDSQVTAAELAEIQHILSHAPLAGPLTRRFGRVGQAGIFHTGIDLAGATGAEVLAPGAGVVSFVGFDQILGHVLVISHTARLETMYGHNSKTLVRVGDSVLPGQVIAEVGNTGVSSAPHLHFEIHWQGNAIDPLWVYPSLRRDLSALEEQ
jgi:murein DD-endopeptidase MepM/ murein hydrolase activator NlpD